jgi:hypothetical protein
MNEINSIHAGTDPQTGELIRVRLVRTDLQVEGCGGCIFYSSGGRCATDLNCIIDADNFEESMSTVYIEV